MTHLTYTHQALSGQKFPHSKETVIPKSLTIVEISFCDHEFYADKELIAAITHDEDLTQPWVVIVNNIEVHRANTWARCQRYIQWHHQNGTLPEQEQQQAVTTTGNEIMAQIANECENYGFDLMDDGIYNCDVKLGEVGYSEDFWWVIRASEEHKGKIPCKSALDAVLALSRVSTDVKSLPQQEIRKLVAA